MPNIGLFTQLETYASHNRDLLGFGNHITSYLLGGSRVSSIPVVIAKSSTRGLPEVQNELNATSARTWNQL